MAQYRLDVLLPPDELLGHRREFQAQDDEKAILRANEFYERFAANETLDRYVLYEGDRVVHERLGLNR